MKNAVKGAVRSLLTMLLTKAVFSPIGLAVIAVILILMLSVVFALFPMSEGFDKDNPNANKNILDKDSSYVTCRSSGEIDMKQYTEEFKTAGVFTKKGDLFIDVAKQNHIDPVLLAAIAFHETGFGSSPLVVNNNNPGGLYNSETDDFYHYDTLKDGLDAMADNLYKNYYAEGLFTIQEIGQKYAPVGAGNDPNNLNTHWIPTITDYVNNLGGMIAHCNVSSDGFVIPVSGKPNITSPYGKRIDPITGVTDFHDGLDFDCQKSDPIFAVRKGKVVYAQFNNGGYGNLVIIKHPNNLYTAYAHMSSINANKGQTVKQKQRVGICGTTGSSTGTHLHLEVRLGSKFGETTDPAKYLPIGEKKGNGN